jgi:hypothetical protein
MAIERPLETKPNPTAPSLRGAQAVRSDFPLATPPLNLPQGIRFRYFGGDIQVARPDLKQETAHDSPKRAQNPPKMTQDPRKTTQDPAPKPTTDNTRPPMICQGLRRRPGRSLLNSLGSLNTLRDHCSHAHKIQTM